MFLACIIVMVCLAELLLVSVQSSSVSGLHQGGEMHNAKQYLWTEGMGGGGVGLRTIDL